MKRVETESLSRTILIAPPRDCLPMVSTALPTDSRLIKVALIGNPNTGKSTLFNALAGMNARIGNYPGVTVEKKVGRVDWSGHVIDLIDLPGAYSLSPRSLDEMVSVEVLTGHQRDIGNVDAIACIADAANLERNLYLLSQLLDLGVPVVLILNMWDAAQRNGLKIDVDRLSQHLGIPVVVTEAHKQRGIDEVRQQLVKAVDAAQRPATRLFPDCFYSECDRVAGFLAEAGIPDVPGYQLERMLLDVGGYVERRYGQLAGSQLGEFLEQARERLRQSECAVPVVEAKLRYAWAREILSQVVEAPVQRQQTLTDRLDAVLTNRWLGMLIFVAMMFLVFQAIYTWAAPLMELCEVGQEFVSNLVTARMPPGPLRSLLVDGVIAGVGGVVIFLPQIVLLFFFISLLEDCGYMARAAFMMDRVMSRFGLSGKSFLPLMSSFACAIPGVMATRVIENRRDRMVTILVAPLMSCSARLPVYLLLIGAFIPATTYLGGFVSLRGLVLLAMSSLGAVIAIPVAWLLKSTLFRGEVSPFVMELPEYKIPSGRVVLQRVYDRGKAFLVRAGTLIFATTILVWAAGYFPGDHTRLNELESQIELLETGAAEAADESTAGLDELVEQRNRESARLIASSVLGRVGHAIEPLVRPLGWDWKIGVGAIASFPAREVIIATLGTIYSLGGDIDEEDEGLVGAMKTSRHPDGRPVYNIPVACSIMVFFALCAQCASTLMIIRRETNSWKWAAFSFSYMTVLAYLGALISYQIGMTIG